MIALLALFACGGAGDTADSTALTEEPLPEVWGVEAAVDLDPAVGVVEYDLSAETMTVDWAGAEIDVLGYNGQIPGPLLQARVGDLVRINFTNNMEEETTVHWHGLRIENAMDGTPAVMNPVQPGETFVYEFVVPEAGSYWYHPHIRTNYQMEMGLQGLFVVHEEENVDVAADRYFTFDDVLMNSDGTMAEITGTGHEGMMGRFGNMLLMNGEAELPVMGEIERGTAERWRVVNTANARTMWVKVEGAAWRVVGTDGGLLEKPFTRQRMMLPVGQRFDLEVIPEGDAEEVKLLMQLPGSESLWDSYEMYTATVTGDSTEVPEVYWPPFVIPEREEAQQETVLEFDAKQGLTGNIKWLINGETFDKADPIHVYNVPTLLTVRDVSGMGHPFHLHGQFFEVLTRDGEEVGIEESGLKDTVFINGGEEVVLYTGFENLGSWMTHCHILEHAESGMMVELIVEEQSE